MTAARLGKFGMLLIATAVAAGGPAPRPEVVADRLDVFAEPDEAGFVTDRLARGDAVAIRKVLSGGWLAIEPSGDAFLWVDDESVEVARDGRITVKSPTATLRLGREGATRPGPPRLTLPRGAVLAQARQPLLTYGQARSRRVWRAVRPGPDEVRFVRASGVSDPGLAPTPAPSPERRASTEGDGAGLPVDLVAPLRRVEGTHRAIVSGPVQGWDLSAVREQYRALLAGRSEPAARAAIGERIDAVEREAAMAKAARTFEALVAKSRKRDAEVKRIRAIVADLRRADDLAFDAEGLLQATAKRVDGEKVLSLLDDSGRIVAYLTIPPGVETANLLARHVGVRGKSRFNEDLRFRLVDVREIERLDPDR